MYVCIYIYIYICSAQHPGGTRRVRHALGLLAARIACRVPRVARCMRMNIHDSYGDLSTISPTIVSEKPLHC